MSEVLAQSRPREDLQLPCAHGCTGGWRTLQDQASIQGRVGRATWHPGPVNRAFPGRCTPPPALRAPWEGLRVVHQGSPVRANLKERIGDTAKRISS